MSYILSCESTADLNKEKYAERDIKYVCFHLSLDGVNYDDDGVQMPSKELYAAMVGGADAKTSQVSVQEYIDFWEPFLKEGKDIMHCCLSSGISGTYNSAKIAQKDMQEKYPDRKLYVVDSIQASAGFGLVMEYLADLRDEGRSIDEVNQWIEENKINFHGWFFSGDLTFFIKGGRVSKPAGFLGNMLGICPLMEVDYVGALQVREKIRGKKKVIKRIVDKMLEVNGQGSEYDGKCFISHSDCYEDARAVADLVEEMMPKLKGKVEISNIGGTIGCHTGPGTVAMFFYGVKRVD